MRGTFDIRVLVLAILAGCDCDEGGQEILDSGPLDAATDAAPDGGDGDADGDVDGDVDADGDADGDVDGDVDADADVDAGGGCDEPDAGCIAWTCGGEFPPCGACPGCDPRPVGEPDPCNDLAQVACEDAEACEPVVVGDCRGCANDTYVGCEATCERVAIDGCLLLSHCQVAQGDPDRCVRRDRRCDTADADACYERYTCRAYPDEPDVGVCVPAG